MGPIWVKYSKMGSSKGKGVKVLGDVGQMVALSDKTGSLIFYEVWNSWGILPIMKKSACQPKTSLNNESVLYVIVKLQHLVCECNIC